MPTFTIVLILLAITVAGFFMGRARALAAGQGDSRILHSRPNYYGVNVALGAAVPGFVILGIWLIAQPLIVGSSVQGQIPQSAVPEDSSLSLMMTDVRRVADGLDVAVAQGAMTAEEATDIRTEFTNVRERLASVGVALGSNVSAEVLFAAQKYRAMSNTATWAMTFVVLLVGLAGFLYAYKGSLHKSTIVTA